MTYKLNFISFFYQNCNDTLNRLIYSRKYYQDIVTFYFFFGKFLPFFFFSGWTGNSFRFDNLRRRRCFSTNLKHWIICGECLTFFATLKLSSSVVYDDMAFPWQNKYVFPPVEDINRNSKYWGRFSEIKYNIKSGILGGIICFIIITLNKQFTIITILHLLFLFAKSLNFKGRLFFLWKGLFINQKKHYIKLLPKTHFE